MAVSKEQKLVAQIVDAVSDRRFNPHKFGRLAQSQPLSILCLQADAYLAFFEMLSIRWDAGDFEGQDHDLLRISKRIATVWAEEYTGNN